MTKPGDELLFLVSGAVTVTLELPDGDRLVELGGGDALVVPQGVWHKITLREPGRLVHVTPGRALCATASRTRCSNSERRIAASRAHLGVGFLKSAT